MGEVEARLWNHGRAGPEENKHVAQIWTGFILLSVMKLGQCSAVTREDA